MTATTWAFFEIAGAGNDTIVKLAGNYFLSYHGSQ